jgi:ArsR family transcriptional regulator, lead/cadmium/zinc/bismuth-responsive transcriptional repressor
MMSPERAEALESNDCDVRVIHLDRVARARSRELDSQTIERLSDIFKVIGNPTRLRLVMALRDEEMCVCDLAASLSMSESAVSHQLRRLRDQSLVRSRREGQVVYYFRDDDHVAQLLDIGLLHARE